MKLTNNESGNIDQYKPRYIRFSEILTIGDWQVKIYSISKTATFQATDIYQYALDELPKWLEIRNSFDASHDRIAFLIIHAGTEGVFSIINWWVGKNMLNTHIFFTDYENPGQFKKISGDGLSPCIWELEVIDYERKSWIENVLKKPEGPTYKTYLKDQYNGII